MPEFVEIRREISFAVQGDVPDLNGPPGTNPIRPDQVRIVHYLLNDQWTTAVTVGGYRRRRDGSTGTVRASYSRQPDWVKDQIAVTRPDNTPIG